MSTPKYAAFFNNLSLTLGKIDPETIKVAIGDSTNNNRVPTVNQVIRFLTRPGATRGQRAIGNQLANVYDLLRSDILVSRAYSNSRTDAIDINELLNVYGDLVLNGPTSFRRVVSRSLAA